MSSDYQRYSKNGENDARHPSSDKDAKHLYLKYKAKYTKLKAQIEMDGGLNPPEPELSPSIEEKPLSKEEQISSLKKEDFKKELKLIFPSADKETTINIDELEIDIKIAKLLKKHKITDIKSIYSDLISIIKSHVDNIPDEDIKSHFLKMDILNTSDKAKKISIKTLEDNIIKIKSKDTGKTIIFNSAAYEKSSKDYDKAYEDYKTAYNNHCKLYYDKDPLSRCKSYNATKTGMATLYGVGAVATVTASLAIKGAKGTSSLAGKAYNYLTSSTKKDSSTSGQ